MTHGNTPQEMQMSARSAYTRSHYRPKPFTPMAFTEEDAMRAVKSLIDARVAFYQPLYLDGFATPGNGGPWKADFEFIGRYYLACDPTIIAYGRTPGELLDRVRAISDAIDAGRTRVHSAACCPLAEIRPCICDIAFRCQVHGDKCSGTHD